MISCFLTVSTRGRGLVLDVLYCVPKTGLGTQVVSNYLLGDN